MSERNPILMSRLRWLTAGESHGPALVATLEGLPAGVRSPRRWWRILARRRLMAARRHLYEGIATTVVPTNGRTPEEVTQAALETLELREA